MSQLFNQVRNQNVRFVLQEVYRPTSLSRTFASKANAALVVLPSMVGAEEGIVTIWDKFGRIVDLITTVK